ncbi:MAG: hypothetical protein QOJ48_437 [Frankiales bacterium]|jgi:hypothetical protein|nr:hypothetical protein [Frankiales bacterium]
MATNTTSIETFQNGVVVATRTATWTTTPEQDNTLTLQQQAVNALTANRTYVASTPTAAQTTAQVKALSRQVNGLIRMLLQQLDGTD